jgi:hypothetical protein
VEQYLPSSQGRAGVMSGLRASRSSLTHSSSSIALWNEEAAVGSALAEVHIGSTFSQAESHELICFRCANLGTDAHMIELDRHKLSLAYS